MEQTAMESTPLLNEETGDGDIVIPSWDNLVNHYESRWRKEKEKFHLTLKKNFKTLVERFACGKQELYSLCCPERLEKKYTRAFLELFESGYAPHVGDVERLAGKRVRRLFVTLPNNYAD
tara:strand:+ start:19 stop:378 length:360 start_codon:yes stop_codon:yes gene_type:complete